MGHKCVFNISKSLTYPSAVLWAEVDYDVTHQYKDFFSKPIIRPSKTIPTKKASSIHQSNKIKHHSIDTLSRSHHPSSSLDTSISTSTISVALSIITIGGRTYRGIDTSLRGREGSPLVLLLIGCVDWYLLWKIW